VGVELLPDWTTSRNPRLARFDAVIKIARGATVPAGSQLRVRLSGGDAGTPLVRAVADIGGIAGPSWRELRGALLEIEPSIAAAEGELAGRVSPPVYRRDATTPVSLTAIRDTIGLPDEPLLWWRYYNAAPAHVAVQPLRARAALRADDHVFRLSGTYNGPAELPPGRAMSGLVSADHLQGLPPGTHRLQLVMGHEVSAYVTATIPT
jgi:hypothetical protein